MPATVTQVRRKIAIFLFLILAALACLAVRIAWVQFAEGSKLAERSRTQLKDNKILQSPRGTIYDRNGRELAISTLAKSLYVNPRLFNKDPVAVANQLAPILAMKSEDIRACLMSSGNFVWLKRTLEPDAAERVIALIKEQNISGLEFIEESKRYYPNNRLAAQVLGFVGTDDIGLDGIEMTLDKTIKGVLIRQAVDTDSQGIPIFKSILSFNPTRQEKSVFLTIDSTIQFLVEQNLDKVMAQTKAKAATVIIMNCRTGEILAMGCRPTYDPNQFYRFSEREWKNRAVSIVYEPGSTFKAVIAAAALQEKLVTANERFIDSGHIVVSGRRIKNWNDESYGSVSFLDIIKNSINTGFVQVGLRLGTTRLNQYTQLFGFGKITGIELPGEEEGLLFDPHQMHESDLATMSIGQSIAVTPLQLITAVAAIANDGVLVKPHIIKEIYNADGTLAVATLTERVRQVISPETAKELALLLEKVVSEGGGKQAAVKGYRFAGKTGTAEKLKENGGGYEAGHYIASFVGFGPVEDPQVVALVIIDDPVGVYYGGQIAAPIFSEIMTQVMRNLSIRPQSNPEAAAASPRREAPSIPIRPRPALQGKVLVPSVIGKTMRDAGDCLAESGLSFVPVGTGVAVKQSIIPTTAVDLATEVTVYFEPR